MSIIKHVTLQKIVAHDFRYDPHISISYMKTRIKHSFSGMRILLNIPCTDSNYFSSFRLFSRIVYLYVWSATKPHIRASHIQRFMPESIFYQTVHAEWDFTLPLVIT